MINAVDSPRSCQKRFESLEKLRHSFTFMKYMFLVCVTLFMSGLAVVVEAGEAGEAGAKQNANHSALIGPWVFPEPEPGISPVVLTLNRDFSFTQETEGAVFEEGKWELKDDRITLHNKSGGVSVASVKLITKQQLLWSIDGRDFKLSRPLNLIADETDLNTIVKNLETQMKSGDADASAILSDLNADGFLENFGSNYSSFEFQKSLIMNAHNAGSVFGNYAYGFIMQIGALGIEKNESEGKKLVSTTIPKLKDLAESGNPFACVFLYHIYAGGQSSEGVNLEEALIWLQKGVNLNNPICVSFMTEHILKNSTNEEELNKAFESLDWLESVGRIGRKKINDIYIKTLLKRFGDEQFDVINCSVGNSSVTSIFRNEKLKCTLRLIYSYDKDTSTVSGLPNVSVFRSNKPIPSNDSIVAQLIVEGEDAIDNTLPYWQKAVEWRNKAFEIFPPAFTKFIDGNDHGRVLRGSIRFYWNGFSNVYLLYGHKQSETFNSIHLQTYIKLAAGGKIDDISGFMKNTQAQVDEILNTQTRQQNIIDSNFN